MKRKQTPEMEEEEEEEEDEYEGVNPAAVIQGSRRELHELHRHYRLDDTRETRLEPMRLTLPTEHCYPCFSNCIRHACDTMLQIYSLKLNLPAKASTEGGGPVHLYGFMAARDLLDPLRDDPLVIQDIHSDPSIYPSGPKRGIYLQCTVLIEYEMWIKTNGDREEDDLLVIDGVFACSELTFILGPFTNRIKGERPGGASVDVSRALFRGAVEATVDVDIVALAAADGREEDKDLSVCAFVPPTTEEIKLFRGVVEKPGRLGRFVVAVISDSFLLVFFKVPGGLPEHTGKFAFRAVAHGCIDSRREFSFGTIEVKVTWSGLC
ncbi:hypothetical protein PR202_gb24199 [Eleusine coracana subsp. coracana]|uniref:DUF6598 domain-containing protein n=1 Tax=Eleusine coracana subsp. coracana TaxID=191504 RepID=A0AAV5FL06_ELECO|nr:hypothetical protein QOZ80_5BG0445710 [Eleusine coracana subsp. coracana]GJN35423.1 hypothetical protein PR202_gb24199 [Eleusine coracana subsp. coracana]